MRQTMYRYINKIFDCWVIGHECPEEDVGYALVPTVLSIENYPTLLSVIRYLKEQEVHYDYYMVEFDDMEFDLREDLARIATNPEVLEVHCSEPAPTFETSIFEAEWGYKMLIPDLVMRTSASWLQPQKQYFYKGEKISPIEANKIKIKAWNQRRKWILNGLPDLLHSWQSKEVVLRKTVELQWTEAQGIEVVKTES